MPLDFSVLSDSDEDTFSEAYYQLYSELVRVAYLLTSDTDDARDIVQDSFLAAHQTWATISNPAAYLRRSVSNRASNLRRDRTRRSANLLRYGRDAQREVADTEYLADLITKLPYRERGVVVLRFYLGLSTVEIAGALEMKPGSVGPTLTRALRRLEKAMTNDPS